MSSPLPSRRGKEDASDVPATRQASVGPVRNRLSVCSVRSALPGSVDGQARRRPILGKDPQKRTPARRPAFCRLGRAAAYQAAADFAVGTSEMVFRTWEAIW